MKKLVCIIFCLFMICSLSVVCSAEENYVKTDQKIMYENKYININESIVNINGSIYVPVRTFCEQIGYTVNWTPEAITLIKNEKNILIDKQNFVYVESKGYIGLRILGNLLNKKVDYDNNSRTALLDSDLPKIKTVMIDAGHGGDDPGAVDNEVEEKTANLYISKKVQELLTKEGYKVIMTREKDVYLSLSDRYNYANEQNVDLFISIHNNSAENSKAKGTEVLCHTSEDSKKLAQNILDAIVERINTTNRGLKDGSRMAVIRNTNMPAVIVEGLFISNSSDAKMLKDTKVLDAIAEGIYVGIKRTLA